jgi:hypothetical protein
MLKRIDKLGDFPRDDILTDQFLILGGHGSHFDLPLLGYVNDKNHHWWSCLGTPHHTAQTNGK